MQVPIVQSLDPELKPEPGPTGHWASKPFASRAKGSLPLSVERDGSDSREDAQAEGSGELAPVALDEMGNEVVAAGAAAAAATAATEAVAASSAAVPLSKVALIKAVGSSGATATKLVATGSMSSAGSHAVAASAVAAAAAATSSAGGVGSSQPLTGALLLLLH